MDRGGQGRQGWGEYTCSSVTALPKHHYFVSFHVDRLVQFYEPLNLGKCVYHLNGELHCWSCLGVLHSADNPDNFIGRSH